LIAPINRTMLRPAYKTLPKGLIYKIPNDNLYKLIDLKKRQVVGEMLAFPEPNSVRCIYDVPADKKNFKIHSLNIYFFHQNKGWGEYFMNFAKKESYNTGCEGRLYLIAYNPFEPPHVFYRKQGLIAKDRAINNRLNSCIKRNDFLCCYPPCEMYLPLDNNEKKQKNVKNKSFWNTIKNFLGIKNK